MSATSPDSCFFGLRLDRIGALADSIVFAYEATGRHRVGRPEKSESRQPRRSSRRGYQDRGIGSAIRRFVSVRITVGDLENRGQE